MKKICFLQLFLVIALAVHAQPTKIFVWLATGEQVTYNLADRPKMVVENDNVHLTTTTADIVYAAKDIKKVTFDGQTDGIEQATTAGKTGEATLSQEFMTLTGFKSGEAVHIFDAAGRLIVSDAINSDGSLTIMLSTFKQGVYIVKTQYKSFKFIKK
ncbi:T9SS type A sorting domain-containing protein [Prevotella falsenii]|uniref:T9SS type A sorting domain-containing protein n=1 Tax=Prevotella falsenii TaxID=515414 RepID=UPI00056AF48C|nr:T9SS type A sorting domain-containing protein [Prevotella falsenii]